MKEDCNTRPIECLIENARAYRAMPKFYETYANWFFKAYMLISLGCMTYPAYTWLSGAVQTDEQFVTTKVAELAFMGAAGLVGCGLGFLLLTFISLLRMSHETLVRFDDIERRILDHAIACREVDMPGLAGARLPSCPVPLMRAGLFGLRGRSWGRRLLIVVPFFVGIGLQVIAFAALRAPAIAEYLRQYVDDLAIVYVVGVFCMLLGALAGMPPRTQPLTRWEEMERKGGNQSSM